MLGHSRNFVIHYYLPKRSGDAKHSWSGETIGRVLLTQTHLSCGSWTGAATSSVWGVYLFLALHLTLNALLPSAVAGLIYRIYLNSNHVSSIQIHQYIRQNILHRDHDQHVPCNCLQASPRLTASIQTTKSAGYKVNHKITATSEQFVEALVSLQVLESPCRVI